MPESDWLLSDNDIRGARNGLTFLNMSVTKRSHQPITSAGLNHLPRSGRSERNEAGNTIPCLLSYIRRVELTPSLTWPYLSCSNKNDPLRITASAAGSALGRAGDLASGYTTAFACETPTCNRCSQSLFQDEDLHSNDEAGRS